MAHRRKNHTSTSFIVLNEMFSARVSACYNGKLQIV